VEQCGACPVFASFTPAFALQLKKKHGKTSLRLRRTSVRLRRISVRVQYTFTKTPTHLPKHPHVYQNTHTFTRTPTSLPKHPHIYENTHTFTKTPTHLPKHAFTKTPTQGMFLCHVLTCPHFKGLSFIGGRSLVGECRSAFCGAELSNITIVNVWFLTLYFD
jgi:hypothetical protein